MNMARNRTAARARRRGFAGTRVDPNRVPDSLNPVGLEACWQKIPPEPPDISRLVDWAAPNLLQIQFWMLVHNIR